MTDAHDQRWLAAVQPDSWTPPTPAKRYNLVVIGAGTAGLITAAAAAGLGAKVALVERHRMGGDCLNVGCVPSKALLRAAHAASAARHLDALGGQADNVTVDFASVMERMRSIRADIAPHDSASRYRDLGVDVFLGEGRFTGEGTLQVDDVTLRFKKAVIATGARAAAPPIPGLEEVGYLTNETVFSLTELPKRLLVIGGGPIGCELGQAFRSFGSDVHIVDIGSRLLANDHADAGVLVQQSLERDGVSVLLDATIKSLSREHGSTWAVVAAGGETHSLEVDAILVAAGRRANVETLGLESVGVERDDRGRLVVDDKLRTTNKRIFAAGDVAGTYQFTHAADAMARIVIRNALFGFLPGKQRVSRLVMPWVTYTQPEVAHVGLRLRDAEQRGIATDVMRQELKSVDRALLDGTTEGFLEVLLKKGSDQILGATLVSPHAGETIAQLGTAIQHGIGLGKLASVIHPYPTQAEVIKRAADGYNRTRLTPFAKRLFARIFKWTR